MSRCGTVRSLPVAAASAGLRDSGIGAPPQSDLCGWDWGGWGALHPSVPPAAPRPPRGDSFCWDRLPAAPHGGTERRECAPRKGEQRDWHPTGDAEGWGTCRGHPTLGTRDMQGTSRGNGQRDRRVRSVLGCEDANEGGTPRVRNSWVTSQREDGDIPWGIGGIGGAQRGGWDVGGETSRWHPWVRPGQGVHSGVGPGGDRWDMEGVQAG